LLTCCAAYVGSDAVAVHQVACATSTTLAVTSQMAACYTPFPKFSLPFGLPSGGARILEGTRTRTGCWCGRTEAGLIKGFRHNVLAGFRYFIPPTFSPFELTIDE